MSERFEIVEATSEHVRKLGQSLREEDRREMTLLGLTPHHALWRSWKRSIIRRAALVGDEVGGMWGVAGTPMGLVGEPWFLTGPAAERVSRFAFARAYRAEVREMLRLFPLLENYVDASYDGAIRMLRLSGFKLDQPHAVPGSGAMFQRFSVSAH